MAKVDEAAARATEALFWDDFVRQFQGVARPAKRKLEAINAAVRLDDLKVPPQPAGEAKRQLEEFLLDPHQRSMAGNL